VTDAATARSRWRRWGPWIGGAASVAALTWVLHGVDFDRFLAVLAGSHIGFLALVPVAIAGEQLVRAWKWRQLLYPIRPAGTFGLFGAIMAGYFASLVIPFGASPLVRSWLVARREGMKTSSVLATVAIDRLIDGIVFTGFVPIALVLVAVPDPTGGIRAGLSWGAGVSLVLFVLLLLALAGFRLQAMRGARWLAWWIDRLPRRFAEPAHKLARSFAEGIVWPKETGRRLGIVLATVAIKLIAATHLLWAGLALGVLLRPAEYLFLLVFLGFLHVLAHYARIVAGFTIGAVFALGLLGVPEEQALAMALIVQGASLLTVAGIGALTLWWQGIALGELRAAGGGDHARCG
jgi:uncharacterized membrane protein YbhN (UPF0104 family)